MPAEDLQKKQLGATVDNIIHLPDKAFVDWCFDQYAVNRGVYNVIDQWFFDFGIEDIVSRRKFMIYFLNYVNKENKDKKKFIQFGKGGVKNNLYYFVGECLNREYPKNEDKALNIIQIC